MARCGSLERLAVGFPVHLEVFLPDDDQRRNVHLSQQRSRVRQPELTGEGQVDWRLQTLDQHLDSLWQLWIRRRGLPRHEAGDSGVVERQQRGAVGNGGRLRRQLSPRHHANGPSRWGDQRKPREGNSRALGLIVQGVQRSLAVRQSEEPPLIDIVPPSQKPDRARQLLHMAPHAELAGQNPHILARMGTRSALVVAQGGDAHPRERLR